MRTAKERYQFAYRELRSEYRLWREDVSIERAITVLEAQIDSFFRYGNPNAEMKAKALKCLRNSRLA